MRRIKEFLQEYKKPGHMREVDKMREPNVTYYAPHHDIYKPEKCTTKLRAVFNCSAAASNGTSLNDLQYNGRVIQDDVFTVMISFRGHVYALTADVNDV